MSKKPSKHADAIQANTQDPQRRWVRNGELARYLGVGKMTLWRWQREDDSFPKAKVRNGIPFYDLTKIDEWMDAGEQVSA
jgi:predicted DNA-binding transcriptional regulator AlpA